LQRFHLSGLRVYQDLAHKCLVDYAQNAMKDALGDPETMRELYLPLRRKLSLVALIMTTVFALPVTRLGATQEPVRCPNPVYEAQRFVQTLYPETRGKGYAVLFSVGGTYDEAWKNLPRLELAILETNSTPSIDLLVGDTRRKYKPLNPELIASFYFDKDGRIESVTIQGNALVNDKKDKQISVLVKTHRNLSDAQVVRALKEAGAKYGPEDKDSFLASLPLKDLEEFLGKLTIKSAEFHLRHDQPGGPIPELRWSVEAESRSAGGKIQIFTLIFEPFAGKLNQIVGAP
jgi:hypothetical protein